MRGAMFLVVLAASAAWSGAARARGLDVDTFTFELEPDRITLGETKQATLKITAVDDDGKKPLDVAAPTLQASTGRLGVITRVGPGVWKVPFTPPSEAFPHVAIVSAAIEHGDETAVGFVALALWGKGQTAVNTKPNSQVTVFIGADRFGPVASGPAGEVSVPILVPPGPEHAIARSVDAVGNESQKSISLGVPAFNRIALVALDEIVVGDGEGTGRLLAFVVDKKGAPLVDGRLVVKASLGSAASPVEVAPGVFEVIWKPGTVRSGEATVSVALAGAPLSVARTKLRVIPGAPVRAEIVLPRRAVSADEDPSLPVRLALFDAANSPVPVGAARVDVDYGRLEQGRGDITRQVAWVLPRARHRDIARLTVRSVDGQVLGTAEVALTTGRPASLRIDALPDLVSDGSAGAPIAVAVLDAAGNELSPRGVVVEVTGGRVVAPGIDVEARRLKALYVPEPRDDDTVVDVVARLDGLVTTAPLRLRARLRAALLVGPGIGTSWGYGDVVGVGPELSMLVRLPVLDGALHTGLTVGVHEGLPLSGGSSFSQFRTFPVLAEAGWRPLLSPEFGLHLGVAGGLVVVDAVAPKAGIQTRTIEPTLGGAVVVGVAVKAGPGFVELDGRVGGAVGLTGAGAPVASMPLGAGLVLGYRFGL